MYTSVASLHPCLGDNRINLYVNCGRLHALSFLKNAPRNCLRRYLWCKWSFPASPFIKVGVPYIYVKIHILGKMPLPEIL